MDDTPAFEIIRMTDGHRFRIFADGRTEGFDGGVIVNRIPAMLTRARVEGCADEGATDALDA